MRNGKIHDNKNESFCHSFPIAAGSLFSEFSREKKSCEAKLKPIGKKAKREAVAFVKILTRYFSKN